MLSILRHKARPYMGNGSTLFQPIIVFFMVLFLAGVSSYVEANDGREKRPNVLLITVDTLRADHLGCYGYARETSPNIDALARQGALFSSAMCNWPKTTPSMASMLTGTYGSTNGVKGGSKQKLPLDLTTIAEALAANGYETGAVVNNANLGRVYQFDQGFSDFVEIWEQAGPATSERLTDRALEWLGSHKTGTFFLWIHYLAPHARYQPPPPFDMRFSGDRIAEQTRSVTLRVYNRSYKGLHRELTYLPPHKELAHYLSQYDGEIAYVDSQIGRVMGAIEDLGVAGNTLTILTADHGEEMGEHGRYFEHGEHPYQSTMHVPLILRLPGVITPGEVVRENIALMSLYPTILDYCGVEPSEPTEGQSLKAMIHGRTSGRSRVFSEGGYRNRRTHRYHSMVYDGKWKLIHFSRGGYELYDLEADPEEQTNLIKKEKAVADQLKEELTSWERAHRKKHKRPGAPAPSKKALDQLKALGYLEGDDK